MSSFNIFSMAFLLALVVIKGADLIADGLVHPVTLEKNVYIIEGVASAGADQDAADTGPEIEPIEPLLASANLENGQKVAKKCLQCHTFEKGGKAKTGPNLWDIVEQSVGAVEGYAYSKAMKAHGGKWTYAILNDYLYKPRKAIPGTKMSFAGLKKVQDRADLIAYIATLSDSPKPFPAIPAGPPIPAGPAIPIGPTTQAEPATPVGPTA
tara:strand:- start:2855 stop:3484 length:630 start_codon:yes stop_codon:yes gene_type:complete